MTTLDAERWARELDGAPPLAVLRWAADRFGPRVTMATAFGAEGCVLLDLVGVHRLPIDVFTVDTGLFFEETYELWRRLEERYDLRIRSVRPVQTVDEQAAAWGPQLWRRAPGQCCELRKVVPLGRALEGHDAWISAIRRGQTPERSRVGVVEWDTRFEKLKINPLAHWTADDVRDYLRANGVPHNPLHDRGYPSIGCVPCTSPVATGEDERAGRWRGHAKTECGLHVRPAPRPAADEFFPVFLRLAGRPVLVVGAGPVAVSKVKPLLDAGARVTVVAPDVHPSLLDHRITVRRRSFEDTDLVGQWFVVAAATPEVNREVARAAGARGIFVNAVDDPPNASAYAPAIVRRSGVTVAVSTGGEAPALAGLLREGLDALLPADLDEWMTTARALRPAWRSAGVPMADRRPLLLDAINRLYAERSGTASGDGTSDGEATEAREGAA